MDHPYASFIHRVDKPARYLGGEYQSVRKPWSDVEVRFCLAFPDVYDIGMSHLGTKILYKTLNDDPAILAERAFAPWPDMEKELRERGLPLLSLESARALRDFDAIGCSLQYELTYTNVLTLLDLGGIPLRAAERGEGDPIVWAGGPSATHGEPLSPFIDCFLIGDGEEALPARLKLDAANKRAGMSRRERLVHLAMAGGVYVPSLYGTRVDPRGGFEVVDRPLDPRVPRQVRRALVEDLDKHPFPTDTPVAWAEAVFDRVSVEIARGCTEGCRFCQAGMIYRPVRERDPQSVVDSIVGAIERGGYDEASLTSLSTADYSCITPLVKKVASALRERKVSLSVSSLRAYGLSGDLLDEMAQVRASGLTFAPEAGTQRMRDVINKNVTEEDIAASADNVFSRGFNRMKLYFMIGLPTERDEDVMGIAQTGGRLKRRGRKLRRDAEVVVSVSSHVPKPHTPFQWCAMDSVEELTRKQRLLRDVAKNERVDLKWHESKVSWLEGIFSRGDRRVGDILERAWRLGARFDGWEEHLRLDVWQRAIAESGVEVARYLGEIPLDAKLPWDHLDIGLEDGFLLDEWEKARRDRGSPPCGKPAGTLLHANNVEDALADGRKLVCFDCGVACDMDAMRADRVVRLRVLGAERPADVAPTRPAPVPTEAPQERRYIQPKASFAQGQGTRFRVRYGKLGRAAYISHLDTARLVSRMFRRAKLEVIYSRGFHPHPELTFAPALGLGIAAVADAFDVRVDGEVSAEALLGRLRAAAPDGLRIDQVVALEAPDLGISKLLSLADHALLLPPGTPCDLARPMGLEGKVRRLQKGQVKEVEVGRHLAGLRRADPEEAARLRRALEWGEGTVVLYRLRVGGDGSARPAEVAEALVGGAPPEGTRHARVALWAARADEGHPIDLFDLHALRALAPRTRTAPAASEDAAPVEEAASA